MGFFDQTFAVFVTVLAALFPVMNPLGSAPVFLNLSRQCSPEVRNKLARSIAMNSFFLLACSLLFGDAVLGFFGISLPVLKIAGGAVITSIGWGLLNQSGGGTDGSGLQAINDDTARNHAFYPLTMPLAAGPGAIATVIALAANYKKTPGFNFESELHIVTGSLAAIFVLSLGIQFCFKNADLIEKALGATGVTVLMKLLGFILLAIGLQVIWGGLQEMIPLLFDTITVHVTK